MAGGVTGILALWWRWYGTVVKVRCTPRDVDVDEMRSNCRDVYFENLMGVRWVLHGAGMQFCRPGWRWSATWMELRPTYWDLDAVEMGPGWRWDTRLETWMMVKWNLQGVEMQFSGAGWIWDATRVGVRRKYRGLDWATWMMVICNLDGGNTRI